MTEVSQKRWYLAQLKPNCAKVARRNLEQQDLDSFLPLEEKTLKQRGKFVTDWRPLFPGYIFVRMDRSMRQVRSVNSTYGVTRLVSFGKEPAEVPEELITCLKASCDEAGRMLAVPELEKGDQVTISKGPFSGFVAKVDKMTPDKRVWVLMDMMGSHARMVVHVSNVRRCG